VQVGDVVTSFGDHVLATRDDFRIFSQLTPPGSKVKVGVLRPGEGASRVRPLERLLTTRAAPRSAHGRHPLDCRGLAKGALPPGSTGAPGGEANPLSGLGFEVQDVPRTRAAELPGGRGVQVSRLFGGPARDAKLSVGDILLRVGRAPVASADELRKQVGQWNRQVPLPLLVRTRTRSFWTALRPY
jgi:S1-C subfamily serine protease